jgi:hypothetical protein
MITIVISNNHIYVDSKLYVSLDYEAYGENGEIGIRHINQRDLTLIKGRVAPSGISLNGTTYGTAVEFVAAFNALTAPVTSTSLEDIEENTDYPDTMFGGSVNIAVASIRERVFNMARAGYIYVRAAPGNAQDVYVAGVGVTVGNGELLEAGDRVQYEVDDLSKIYVISVASGQIVYYSGTYKN